MYLLVVIVVYIIFAIKFVKWKKWKEYYPTIQFYIICNLLYNFLFYQHTLWKYKAVTVDWLNHTLIEIAFTFFIIPVVLMLYLEYFPKEKGRGFLYLMVWVAYFSVIEYLFKTKGLFVYENGWSTWWSLLFNIITFTVIRIHYKNALAAFLVSAPIIAILLLFFHPALHDLK
ncbi:CBO0543 family protein [Cytobacillus oceanisediminis]|uniref:CBO0543 family protein n=1 Tax=Cytobacillus oceanisediminis TaxID=665099 RepID=UPI00119CC174|nr:CBO0543 family protein [Cytobacillus oceanisediminis]